MSTSTITVNISREKEIELNNQIAFLLAALKAAPDFGGAPSTAFGREFREWQEKYQRPALASFGEDGNA